MFVCASSVINGYTGGPVNADAKFTPPVSGNSFLGGATTFTRVARTGILASLDVTTNRIAWRYQWPEQCYSGTLATAGNLLFVGRADGRLTALDSTNGKPLWEFQTGAGMHAPVTTFERNGKQYVLAYSAGSALLGSARGDSVWLFGLDGTLPPAAAGTPVSRQTVVAAAGAPNIAAGRTVYTQTCVACHGTDGKGDHGGAPLTALKDLPTTIQTVTGGRNNMPAFSVVLTPEQIRDVSGYIQSFTTR